MESISFWYSNPTDFWHPSRIRFLAPKRQPKREENNGIDKFLVFKSYTFLAPLSDTIFGAEKDPQLAFLVLKSYTFLAPLSDPAFWHRKTPKPKRQEHYGINMCL